MRRRDAGEIELAPPTFVTLHQLAESQTVAQALAAAAQGPVEYFSTRIVKDVNGDLVAVWHGDAAYENDDVDIEGARHRLVMVPDAWTYTRAF
jgi:hypothetical protein